MSWQTALIRSFARSFADRSGAPLDFKRVAKVIDLIDEDEELSREFAEADDDTVSRRFMDLYEQLSD